MTTTISKSSFPIVELRGNRSKVQGVAWNMEGTALATCASDNVCRLYKDPINNPLSMPLELKGHTDIIQQVAWDPRHSSVFVSASSDKSLRFWDMRISSSSSLCTNILYSPGKNLNLRWRYQGDVLGVGSKEDILSFVDMRKMNIPLKHQMPFESNEFSWDPSGEYLYLASGNGDIFVYSWAGLETKFDSPSWTLPGHSSNVFCLQMDPTGRTFATAAGDAMVFLWNARDDINYATIPRLEFPARSIAYSSDGELLATASQDTFLDIANVNSGDQAFKIDTTTYTNSVAFHPVNPSYGSPKYVLAYGGGEYNPSIHGSHKSPDTTIKLVTIPSTCI